MANNGRTYYKGDRISDDSIDDYKKRFAHNLERLMQEKGINSVTLASETGISQSIISHWRNGEKSPTMGNLITLADYFNVDCEYLIKGKRAKNYPISAVTGLSDKAISKLKRLKRDNGLNMMMDALNRIIESDSFEPLLSELVEYVTANPDKSFTYGVHNLKLRDIAEYKIQQTLSTIIKDVEQDFTDNPKSAKEKLYYNLLYAARQNGSISEEEFKIHKREFDSGNFSFAEK